MTSELSEAIGRVTDFLQQTKHLRHAFTPGNPSNLLDTVWNEGRKADLLATDLLALLASAQGRQLPGPDYATLPPEKKIEIIEAMGFSPIGQDHQPDCPAIVGSGLRCNCVPDATSWSQPPDVDEFRGETWEERLARARGREKEKSNGR